MLPFNWRSKMKNKIIHDKLVRDKIPNIIENNNKHSKTYIADQEEYKVRLLAKLVEEAKELQEDPCIEELADIMEVIESIKLSFNFSDQSIRSTKDAKKEARGGFKDKIILEYVYE